MYECWQAKHKKLFFCSGVWVGFVPLAVKLAIYLVLQKVESAASVQVVW